MNAVMIEFLMIDAFDWAKEMGASNTKIKVYIEESDWKVVLFMDVDDEGDDRDRLVLAGRGPTLEVALRAMEPTTYWRIKNRRKDSPS